VNRFYKKYKRVSKKFAPKVHTDQIDHNQQQIATPSFDTNLSLIVFLLNQLKNKQKGNKLKKL